MAGRAGTGDCNGFFCSVAKQVYSRVTGNVTDGEERRGASAFSSISFQHLTEPADGKDQHPVTSQHPEEPMGKQVSHHSNAEPTAGASGDQESEPMDAQTSHKSATSQHTAEPKTGEFGAQHSVTSRHSKTSVKTILTGADEPSMGPADGHLSDDLSRAPSMRREACPDFPDDHADGHVSHEPLAEASPNLPHADAHGQVSHVPSMGPEAFPGLPHTHANGHVSRAPSMGPEAFPDPQHAHANGHVSEERKRVQNELHDLKETLAEVSNHMAEEKKRREDAEAELKKLAAQKELDRLSREAEQLRDRLAQKADSGCCSLRIRF